MYFNAEIRMNIFAWFRDVIEKLALAERIKDLKDYPANAGSH
jgi:hypothetical protein